MIFSSLTFLFAYLPLTLAVYFLAPLRWRNLVLLLVSLFFYGWGEPVYIFIMVLSILIDYTRGLLVVDFKPGRMALNLGLLLAEALVLLADVPLYGLWTGLITLVIILYNFAGVWAMARVLLPRLLGRRGKALVAAVDGWLKPKKA